ncbi:hypothetical protein ABFS82_02G126600 [Erythranthe guttata]|uniref:uncharacterized protein LOC105969418 n=1 Tax=Erythranthe guttata TaxID=4155 RepID=UPI00064DAEBE|nr:PREDICTED: uncharacterized protein LOC105969418 [Erythranthe guttata]|eukprot:XP_012849626.1 PREDICTED: uncharacterized protein LOC105969418 [Erythranthe guttata]
MGKITSEPQKETLTPSITHFSHLHPLTLITTDHQHQHYQDQTLISSSCAGCNLNVSGTNFYTCTVCSFFLHKKCFEMPMKITHPFHKEHTLTLLPKPAYSTGVFNCDACFEPGKGFSYSCKHCGIDLHILCASTPLSVTNATCHPHKLDLTSGSPYDTKNFSCDVCKKIGGDHWLYRCGPCGFDAHLTCARPQINNHSGGTSDRSIHVPQPQPQPASVQQSFVHHPNYYHPPYYHPNMSPHVVPFGYPIGGSVAAVEIYNQMLFQAFQQMAQGNQAMTHAILSGGLGVGDRGVQQLMQMMYGLNNYGGIPGGVGADIFQSWLGNNGIDFLGGGGLDFLGGLGFFLS